MNDIEILENLKERAAERDIGIHSIEYYYALKHAIELMEKHDERLKRIADLQIEHCNNKYILLGLQLAQDVINREL